MFLSEIGSVKTQQFEVGTSAKQLASDAVVSNTAMGRIALEVVNTSGQTVFIGGKDVAIDKGLPLKANESRFFPVNSAAIGSIHIVAEATVSIILAEYFA